jgi:hypothetical protein
MSASPSTRDDVFRDVAVLFRSDDQIEKGWFEAENHLHGRAIEDVVVNWAKIAETKDGSQVLVMAAPKSELAEDLVFLRRAGIEPASIDLDATAFYTACAVTGVVAEHPNAVLLEICARTTNLVLVDGGQLRAVRSFLVGADTVTAAVASDLALPAARPRRALTPPGRRRSPRACGRAARVGGRSRSSRPTSLASARSSSASCSARSCARSRRPARRTRPRRSSSPAAARCSRGSPTSSPSASGCPSSGSAS